MIQLDILEALSRSRDPETSKQAAYSVPVARLEQVVIDYLEECGLVGATTDEISRELLLDKVTISPRMKPLMMKGLIVKNGIRAGASGRMSIVWRIKDVR